MSHMSAPDLPTEASYTGLANDAVDFRLMRVLAADVADLRLFITADEP